MISWVTTIAPATQESASRTFEYSNRENPGGGATTFYTESGSSSTTANFWGTTIEEAWENSFQTGGIGTTTQTSARTQTQNATTSSVATVTSSVNVTTTRTIFAFAYTTSENSNSKQTLVVTTSQRTAATKTTQTATRTKATTATSGTQYAGGAGGALYATIYQAESNEVLWTAANSAMTNVFSGPASAAGSTETRVTIYPPTATVAYSVIDTSQLTTFSSSFSASTQQLTASTTQSTRSPVTSLIDAAQWIPHRTSVVQAPSIATTPTTLSTTVFPASTVTITWQASAVTVFGAALDKTPRTRLGVGYHETFTLSSTRTQLQQNQKYTISYSDSYLVPPTTQTIGFGTSTSTAISYGETLYITSMAGKSGFDRQAYAATTARAQNVDRAIEGIVGFRTPNNNVAAFYNASGLGGVLIAGGFFVLASRNVSTVMPIDKFTYYTSSGDEENYDLENAGVLSVSGLSGTGTRTATDSSATSGETFTFSFVPQGQGYRTQIAQRSGLLLAASLGEYETAYDFAAEGIYVKNGTTTVSKSLGYSSYRNGSSVDHYEPISFFRPSATATQTALVWTASRNSMAVPA